VSTNSWKTKNGEIERKKMLQLKRRGETNSLNRGTHKLEGERGRERQEFETVNQSTEGSVC
jgi:hypothetical protein